MPGASRLGVAVVRDLVAEAVAVGRRLGLAVDDPVLLKDSINLPGRGALGSGVGTRRRGRRARLERQRATPARLGRGSASSVIVPRGPGRSPVSGPIVAAVAAAALLVDRRRLVGRGAPEATLDAGAAAS